MADDKERESGEIKVTDRRRFTEEGTVRTDAQEAQERQPPQSAERELPSIDFSTFILSLASSVQVHLGLVANPTTGKLEKDLLLARQTIDIIGLFEKKTKGNLTPDEDKLLTALLYDLRLMFVEAQKT